MRPTQLRTRRAASSRIVASAKCKTAIPTRDVLLRDAVIQAALDPAVQAIQFGPLEVPDPLLAVGAIVIERDGQRLLLDHRSCETEWPNTVDEEGALLLAVENLGLKLVPLDPRVIRREPRFSNSREVWHYRQHDVALGDRLQIMHALAEHGPQSIMKLASRISPMVDVVGSICALACANIVELELVEKPLGWKTMVRERR